MMLIVVNIFTNHFISLPRVLKIKIQGKSQNLFCKNVTIIINIFIAPYPKALGRFMVCYMKVLLPRVHSNGRIIRFYPKTQKLESPYFSITRTLEVKGLKP